MTTRVVLSALANPQTHLLTGCSHLVLWSRWDTGIGFFEGLQAIVRSTQNKSPAVEDPETSTSDLNIAPCQCPRRLKAWTAVAKQHRGVFSALQLMAPASTCALRGRTSVRAGTQASCGHAAWSGHPWGVSLGHLMRPRSRIQPHWARTGPVQGQASAVSPAQGQVCCFLSKEIDTGLRCWALCPVPRLGVLLRVGSYPTTSASFSSDLLTEENHAF